MTTRRKRHDQRQTFTWTNDDLSTITRAFLTITQFHFNDNTVAVCMNYEVQAISEDVKLCWDQIDFLMV